MRKWISLVEGLTPVLYHGSKTQFKVGTILTPQENESYVLGTSMDSIEREIHDELEEKFEQFRPHNCIPRHLAVFMVTDEELIDSAGGYNDHVYVCRPIGEVSRCNLAWYSMAMGNVVDEDWKRYAENYWHAIPHGEDDLIEYLAHSAVIIQEL